MTKLIHFPNFQKTTMLIHQSALALDAQGRDGFLTAVSRGLLTVESAKTAG